MIDVYSRKDKKEYEQEESSSKKNKRKNNKIKDWYEEFQLNRQGKTKYKRSDVMSKYRRIDRILTGLIVILILLLIITWVIILFY